MPYMDAKAVVLSLCLVSRAPSQTAGSAAGQTVPLIVPAGVPLRLALTKRVSKRKGAPVRARLIEPVYAFDREVIPAGVQVSGTVSRVDPVPRWQRARAILAGDFTPLHVAKIEFTSLQFPDGRRLPLQTAESEGLGTLVQRHPRPNNPPAQAPPDPAGVVQAGKQQVKDQVNAQIDLVKSIPDMVRAPGKMERIEDYLLSRLPYHPQYLRGGTRFDAELTAPLAFGTAGTGALALVGSQPAPGSLAHTRLITPLDSRGSKPGDPVEVELTGSVFSSDRQLVLPAGARLEGAVVVARKARWLHRGGRLRFTFQRLTLPDEVAKLESGPPDAPPRPVQEKLHVRTQATVAAAEGGQGQVKVDGEGGVQARESKTRFIGTAAALMIGRRAGDMDAQRSQSGAVIGQNPNIGGRTVGGGFGFGLVGAGLAQSSRYVGMAFGYYGMAWAVFSTVFARGSEVRFVKNAAIDVGFNPRTPAPRKKPGAAPVRAAN